MIYRNFLFKSLAITFILLYLVAGLNFLVDPLQFYRQAALYRPAFSIEQRYQNPGLVRNYSYDTIIIGSSMTENFVPAYVNKKLGVKSLKLSMSGASTREENLIVQLALNTGKVKNVLWGLDYESLKGLNDRVTNEDVSFPYYLYDQNDYNDLPYLLSISTLKSSAMALRNNYQQLPIANPDLDYLNNWNSSSKFGRDGLMKMWQDEQTKKKTGVKIYDKMDGSFAAMQASFDQNILPLIKDNPEVNFVIYYPPYSILRHRSIFEEDPQLIYSELQMKRYIYTQLNNYTNIRIYDFQGDKSLNTRLDKYKDYSHHSQEFNEIIIDSIARKDKRYLVTPWNMETMLYDLKTQVETIDIGKL
ncbi:MAG: hypothetical protein CVU90_06930 [Firmicutes bacterium HGW-Firmicutes-15]|nr:MAG: hypothetical protein CVU90_06930 [Firmicutes bacterium HGW-Firmicutes-15]